MAELNELDMRVQQHFALFLTKRFAHAGKDGIITGFVPTPADIFIERVSNQLSRAESTLRRCNLNLRQIETPPPEEYLSRLDIDALVFIQHQVDSCTVSLSTMLDHALLLMNEIIAVGLRPQECTYWRISPLVRNYPAVAAALTALKQAIAHIETSRHLIVHRGERRSMPLHNAVHRARLLVQNMSALPPDSVSFNSDGARKEALSFVTADLATVATKFNDIKSNLVALYEARLASFGGLTPPTSDELTRAIKVIDYLFGDGDRPDWM